MRQRLLGEFIIYRPDVNRLEKKFRHGTTCRATTDVYDQSIVEKPHDTCDKSRSGHVRLAALTHVLIVPQPLATHGPK